MQSDHEKLLSILEAGNRNLDQLTKLFPHVMVDLIQHELQIFELKDSIGGGIREIGILKQFHPDLDLDEIQRTLLDSLIYRGESNAKYLQSLCPDIPIHSIQHSVDTHKLAVAQAKANSRPALARALMDAPGSFIAHLTRDGWHHSGHGRRKSTKHHPH